jgi:hypothetical protein
MAFRFFEPMTASSPFCPTALNSLMMQAVLQRFSPAGPMQAIRTFWSFSSFLMICWQSVVFMPQTFFALRNFTSPSLIQT